jgi:ribosomal protein S2
VESEDARFIFAERSGIYIIDLQKTLRQIHAAQELLRGVVLKGEGVLFVCTKKQLKAIVRPKPRPVVRSTSLSGGSAAPSPTSRR